MTGAGDQQTHLVSGLDLVRAGVQPHASGGGRRSPGAPEAAEAGAARTAPDRGTGQSGERLTGLGDHHRGDVTAARPRQNYGTEHVG